MKTPADAHGDLDDEFEYVAPSNVATQPTAGKRAGKTVYEIERDARVTALIESQKETDKKDNPSPTHSPPTLKTLETSGDPGKDTAKKVALTPTEAAQRLKEQRYANYRRNRDLNHSALREVDPETRRFMQIACTQSNSGARQYQTVRRGGFGHGSSSAGNRFPPRGDRIPKRRRDG